MKYRKVGSYLKHISLLGLVPILRLKKVSLELISCNCSA
ncbi:Uncharacterised protein [Vibrio furnissii]|nr:Uncharacterised protein [Vibrio furnissii]